MIINDSGFSPRLLKPFSSLVFMIEGNKNYQSAIKAIKLVGRLADKGKKGMLARL